MEKQILHKAGKDVQIIKDIIERTSHTFVSLGKVFIGWGLVFSVFCMSILVLYLSRSEALFIRRYPYITILPALLIAAFAIASYIIVSRMKGFQGLTKPLLTVWLVLIAYITLSPLSSYLPYAMRMSIQTKYIMDKNYFFMPYAMDVGNLLMFFAFGLLCIRLFTHLRFTGVLSAIYTILAFINVLLQQKLLLSYIDESYDLYYSIFVLSYCIIIPLTFLILGGYLMFCNGRRN